MLRLVLLILVIVSPVGWAKKPGFYVPFCVTQFVPQAQHEIEQIQRHYGRYYADMIRRVAQQDVKNLKQAEDAFAAVVMAYLDRRDRLLQSPHFPGAEVVPYFLPGLVMWTRDLNHLVQMQTLLSDPRYSNVPSRTDLTPLDYMVARLAFGASQTRGYSRDEKIVLMSEYDDMNDFESGVRFDVENLTINVSRPREYWNTRVARLGFHFPRRPISPLNLEFNNGRNMYLFRQSATDLWLAQHISQVSPQEQILGFGDLSTRQFFQILRVIEGRISRFPYSADLFSILPTANGFVFRLREMKFSKPPVPNVGIAHGLEQLQGSWQGIVESLGTSIPVDTLEIVVPKRAGHLQGLLGDDYGVGNTVRVEPKGDVISLLVQRNGPNWDPVHLEVGGVTLAVTIREVPMSNAEYDAIKKRD